MTSATALRLDRATMRRNLDQFKTRWRNRLDDWESVGQGALEKKYAQSFWAELFECFGIAASRMDLFEQDVLRASTGQSGYIDLFWPGVVNRLYSSYTALSSGPYARNREWKTAS